MKKLTRKQAEKILEFRFSDIEVLYYIAPLCRSKPKELKNDFSYYWRKINSMRYLYMNYYFDDYHDVFEDTFLRLLTAHIFIRETYE